MQFLDFYHVSYESDEKYAPSANINKKDVYKRQGGTFDTAENDLATGIDFFTMISMDAKVMCIVKTAFVIPVAEPVQRCV